MNSTHLQALSDVLARHAANQTKWGNQDTQPNATWLAILTEELGEAARAVLEENNPQLRAELVDLTAAALAMVEHLDRTIGPIHLQLYDAHADAPRQHRDAATPLRPRTGPHAMQPGALA